MTFRSGWVGLIGPTNAGKSTLLNRLIGDKLAIVSPKPQTTRHCIKGIYTDKDAQLIFCDTPGLHESEQLLNQAMLKVVRETLKDMDLLCLVVDATAPQSTLGKWRDWLGQALEKPLVLVMNKGDLVGNPASDSDAMRISALTGAGCGALLARLKGLLAEGPAYYPEETYTEHSLRFIATEIIREKCLLRLEQEVPYGTAVVIDTFKEESLVTIEASIIVNREGHKAIVIGKGGATLKSIGQAAREELERMLEKKVFLKLFVRVEKNWIRDAQKIKEWVYGQL